MIKYFISFVFVTLSLYAKFVDGIAMTVDSEPITLYEIRQLAKENNISTEDAVNALVQQKIEEQEIKRLGIYVSSYDIDQEIEKLAKRNGLSMEQFKAILKKRGKDYKAFREEVEKKLKRDKLYQQILSKRMKKPDMEELQSFYNLHRDEFTMPSRIEMIEYLAPSKEALQMQRSQPMAKIPGIKMTPKTVDLTKINPKLGGLLLQTAEGSFTPIVNLGKANAMFFVKQKLDPKPVSFAMAKEAIMAKLMKEREQAALIEYFEKRKSEANIKILRKPE